MGENKQVKFGTFQGVFVPNLLTILGIILFLRLPWVVGEAGAGGAVLIILVSVSITFLTSLSLSSIISNIRIGSGGAFAIISRSLGLEIGGSIGIPLYLSQAIAVTMYIFGFREGWVWIFPNHSPLIVDLSLFALIFLITFISTRLAFRIQYFVLAIIVIALGSIVAGFIDMPEYTKPIFIGEAIKNNGSFLGSNFWVVFAVFFPAVTGIMAGLNMSGELENPRRSIPKGTLWAVGLSTVVYLSLAIVVAYMGTEKELQDNYTFFVDHAFLPVLVLIGLLGATFSSALSSFVGAPRILEAIAQKNIVPFSEQLKKRNKKGIPAGAVLITAGIVLLSLLLRELNLIAPLITMFFLIAYAMINLVVLIEQSLSLPSFRPTFTIPIYIPLLGTIGCFLVMLIVNPIFSVVAIASVIAIYVYLMRKHLNYSGGYARSGLFTVLAKWATEKSINLSNESEPRSWQPDLLVPIKEPRELRSSFKLLHSIVHPKGSLKVLGVGKGPKLDQLKKEVPSIIDTMKHSGDSISYSFLQSDTFGSSVQTGVEALDASYFKPNSIFLRVDARVKDFPDYEQIIQKEVAEKRGVLLYLPFAQVGTGLEKEINLWLRNVPNDWETNKELGNNDLAVMMALLIRESWKGKLNVILEQTGNVKKEDGYAFLNQLKENARLPKDIELYVVSVDKGGIWEKVPQVDLNIRSFDASDNLQQLQDIVADHRSSFLFTADSNKENAQF